MANPLKDKLNKGHPCIGGWLTTGSPIVAEAMASVGFDWIAIDMEHGPNSENTADLSFIAAECHGTAGLVRLPSADPHLARRMLDIGAAGVIVPAVESSSDFGEFIQHCLYPPKGRRGYALSRCNRWGDSFDSYRDTFEPVIVAMIETPKGVEVAGELAVMDDVDALFLGPYDLSASLGRPGDFTTTEFAAALARVRAACHDNGAAAGIHQVETDPLELRQRIEEGFSFVAYGTDMIAMRAALALPDLSV